MGEVNNFVAGKEVAVAVHAASREAAEHVCRILALVHGWDPMASRWCSGYFPSMPFKFNAA